MPTTFLPVVEESSRTIERESGYTNRKGNVAVFSPRLGRSIKKGRKRKDFGRQETVPKKKKKKNKCA